MSEKITPKHFHEADGVEDLECHSEESPAREAPSMLPSDNDVRDPAQAAAMVALGEFVSEALDRVEIRGDPGSTGRIHRVAFFYVAESLQLVADASLLLRPGENVFAHARAVSGVLRSLVDIFGRQLAIWSASDPDARMAELLGDSIKKELKALESARDAGIDVDDLDRSLQEAQSGFVVPSRPLDVTSTLRDHESTNSSPSFDGSRASSISAPQPSRAAAGA